MKINTSFDHITLIPKNYEKALRFYDEALAPLGIKQVMPKSDSCGFGVDHPFFWLGAPDAEYPATTHVHVAFSAQSKEEVEKFYVAALKAGGTDNGSPDYQTQYHPGYFAAFVFDLDGNNIEAVYRDPNTLSED